MPLVGIAKAKKISTNVVTFVLLALNSPLSNRTVTIGFAKMIIPIAIGNRSNQVNFIPIENVDLKSSILPCATCFDNTGKIADELDVEIRKIGINIKRLPNCNAVTLPGSKVDPNIRSTIPIDLPIISDPIRGIMIVIICRIAGCFKLIFGLYNLRFLRPKIIINKLSIEPTKVPYDKEKIPNVLAKIRRKIIGTMLITFEQITGTMKFK